jgi:hypothetical protein
MKKFLIQNNHVYIEDGANLAISFNTREEYGIFTGKTAPTDDGITYQPDSGIYTSYDIATDTELDLSASIPDANLEEDIASVEQYLFNQRDPFFAASLLDAQKIKYEEVKVHGQSIADAAELVPHVSKTYTDLTEARNDRTLTAEIITFKMATSTDLTAGEDTKAATYVDLSQFRNDIKDEARESKDVIQALLTVEDVRLFDVATDVPWTVWIPVGTV